MRHTNGKLLSITRAAQRLGVRREIIRRACASGELATVRLPGTKFPKVDVADLGEWLGRHKSALARGHGNG